MITVGNVYDSVLTFKLQKLFKLLIPRLNIFISCLSILIIFGYSLYADNKHLQIQKQKIIITPLRQLVKSKTPKDRKKAVEAIFKLKEILKDSEKSVRQQKAIAQLLANITSNVTQLKQRDKDLLQDSIATLGEMRNKCDTKVVFELSNLLESTKDPALQMDIVMTLGDIGPKAESTIPELIRFLKNKKSIDASDTDAFDIKALNEEIITTLKRFGTKSIPAFIEVFPESSVRITVGKHLVELLAKAYPKKYANIF